MSSYPTQAVLFYSSVTTGGAETMNVPARFDHPAWIAGAATAVSYVLGLVAMFVLLFVLPFLLFLGL
jgi:hypothetical protein